jgi:hypothetical protein
MKFNEVVGVFEAKQYQYLNELSEFVDKPLLDLQALVPAGVANLSVGALATGQASHSRASVSTSVMRSSSVDMTKQSVPETPQKVDQSDVLPSGKPVVELVVEKPPADVDVATGETGQLAAVPTEDLAKPTANAM